MKKNNTKWLKMGKKHNITLLKIVLTLGICVVITGTLFYFVGWNDKTTSIQREAEEQARAQQEQKLMKQDFQTAKETFYKHMIIKVMRWSDYLLVMLGLGWVLHGIWK